MSKIAYVDGRFVPQEHAAVAMEDRGYQFADGVYEVIALYENRLLDADGHLARLERSLAELNIPMPMSMVGLKLALRELMRRNRRANGLIYMQVTAGVAMRNHLSAPARPILTMSLNKAKYPTAEAKAKGVKVITVPDERWARCDIKSIALLPNVLARRKAQEAGAYEAWQIKDGVITEGSLSNAYIVKDGVICTHPANESILGGITRETALRLAAERQIAIREEAFTPDDVKAADEAFVTGASAFVMPVVEMDGVAIADGKVGAITNKLMQAYDDYILTQPTCHTGSRSGAGIRIPVFDSVKTGMTKKEESNV